MQTTAVFQTSRPAMAVRSSRKQVIVQAIAKPEAPKQQKAALVAVAAFAAAVLMQVAPADASVKAVVCASNPTAKQCLKGSAKPQ